MDFQAVSQQIAPGEAYIHVQILNEVDQIHWVLKKEEVTPFSVKVVAKQVVKLNNGQWEVVSLEFFN